MTSPPPAAYRIETARTVLRCHEPADAAPWKAVIDANLDYLAPWMPWAAEGAQPLESHVLRMRRARSKFDRDEDFAYGVLAADGEVLGGTGLHTRGPAHAREIGYWIRHDRVGRGLATEVAAALVRVAFEVCGMHRVVVRCDPGNAASARVPAKLGFAREGLARGELPFGESYRDTETWALVRTDYEGSPARAAAVRAFGPAGERLL